VSTTPPRGVARGTDQGARHPDRMARASDPGTVRGRGGLGSVHRIRGTRRTPGDGPCDRMHARARGRRLPQRERRCGRIGAGSFGAARVPWEGARAGHGLGGSPGSKCLRCSGDEGREGLIPRGKAAEAEIGPNCYIRPATSIGPKAKVGNACEVKNSILMASAHVPHQNYVGDSILGERCNLGAGTKVANLRLDEAPVKVVFRGVEVDT